MKKLFIGLALTLSCSTFASIYSGVDHNGDACSVEVSEVDNHKTFVKVVTKDLVSAVYTESLGALTTLKSQSFQGNQEITLRTTDKIVLEMGHGTPSRAEITRNRSIKGNSWFSTYSATEGYGGTQESVCNI